MNAANLSVVNNQKSGAMTVSQKKNNIRSLLEKSKAQIAMALPKHLNADRIVRVAMTSIQRTPKLLECDPISLVGAIIQSSQLGLEPDGVLGHAYLVPFKNSKKNRMEVQFIPGYKGLIDLARRSGQVVSISAHIVYDKEQFELKFGFDETLEHTPLPPSKRGEAKGVYACARLKDGSVHFEWLWAEEVEEIKKSSKAGNFGPWKTHPAEMWRKTAIRRLAKYLPLSVEFSKAAAYDELADAGVNTQEFDLEIEGTPIEENSIDDAFAALAQEGEDETVIEEPQPETTQKVAEKEQNPPKTDQKEPKTNQKPQENDKETQFIAILEEIDSFQIKAGPMTAYVVRAIGGNKPREEWTFEDAGKVLDYVKQMKGVK